MVFMLVMCLGGSGGSPSQGSQTSKRFGGVEVKDIIPKDKPTEITVIQNKVNDGDVLIKAPIPKKAVDADKECPGKWYGGIGVQDIPDRNGEKIAIIFVGYPADLAGLQVGDVITAVSEKEITGPVGTPITLKILRNGSYFDITIIRGKVCYGAEVP